MIRIEDNRNGYRNLVDFVLTRGKHQSSRNGDTIEVSDMIIELSDPSKAIPSGIGRKGYSNALAAIEGLQLVAGQTYDDLLVKIAPNTDQFREDDGKFHGGYGRRIGDQMGTIVDRLASDHDTRQAVITIWDPALDMVNGKKDYPCNCMINFRIRQGALLVTVTQRSADIHWGWPYDSVMFAILQLSVANYLGVRPGTYVHQIASLHAYTRDLAALKSLTPYDGEDLRLAGVEVGRTTSWKDVQKRAQSIVEAARIGDGEVIVGSDRWYFDVLSKKLRTT